MTDKDLKPREYSEPSLKTALAKAIYDINPADGHMARHHQELAWKQADAALEAIAASGYSLEFEGFDYV